MCIGLPVGQNILYLLQAWFMIWNPLWPHQIVFWLQAAISLRFVRIDLKKPEGKNDICSICLRWWTSLTWASSGVHGTWLKQTIWIGHLRTSSLSPRRCTGTHSLHTSLLGKTIPPYTLCASFLWLQIDKVSAQRAKDYTIEACERKQLFNCMLVQTTNFRMTTQSMFPP